MSGDARIPEGYDPRAYPPVAVTVDVVILTIVDDRLQVLLIRRGQDPYQDCWALPGGFVEEEDLDAAALRELQEETGVVSSPGHLEQLACYGAPGRDPRLRVVTVAYWAIIADLPELRSGDDAAGAGLVPVGMVEAGALRLAFDHATIIADAAERVRSRLEYTTLATRFCPPRFTVDRLRRVYEAVWNAPLEPVDFHREVTNAPGFLRSAGGHSGPGDTGEGRAALYRSGDVRIVPSLVSRPRPATGR